jgi:hypothetical protein
MTIKKCSHCSLEKSLNEFNKSKSSKDGLQYVCKNCNSTYYSENRTKILDRTKDYGKRTEVKQRNNIKKRQKRYGVSEEQFEEMKIEQQNKCKICCKELENFHTDHNHLTGAIRGLLCGNCNRGIGFLKEDPAILLNAIKYLKGQL